MSYPYLFSFLAWFAAAPTLLAARVALAVVAAPLLYRALGEAGQGWGGSALTVLRRTAFAALGAYLLFALTASWVPDQQEPEYGRGFQAFQSGSYSFRLGFTELPAEDLPGEGATPRQKSINKLREAVKLMPESVYFQRYLGIALAHAGQYPEALRTLEGAMKQLGERAPDRARQELEVWRALFGAEPPSRGGIATVQGRLDGFGLGWIGRVAVLSAYQRVGPKAAPRELRDEISTEATTYFRRVFLGGAFALAIIPQLGLIALVVGIILSRTGVLPPMPRLQHPVGPILWESFILMLATGLVPVLWMFGGKRPSAETQPGIIAGLLLSRDVIQLSAIAYLAVRLRQRGLSLAEIGLHRRQLLLNVLIGALGALVMIPAAYLINIVTQVFSDRFFPNIAPPYHPLQGLTATSGSAEIRWALFLAAAVGAPLLEEIFFRGALYGALRRRYGVPIALLASSAFFAILHPQLPLGFLPIALLGATFCALYEWRQSLIPGMIAHAMNNGLAFLMLSLVFPMRG